MAILTSEQFKSQVAEMPNLQAKIQATQARLVEVATALGSNPTSPDLWRYICAEKARLIAYSRFSK